MKHFSRKLGLLAVGFSILTAVVLPAQSQPLETLLLKRLNEYRQAKDLQPLVKEPVFEKAARAHAQVLRSGEFFGNVTPGGTGPLDRVQSRNSRFIGQVNQSIYGLALTDQDEIREKLREQWLGKNKRPEKLLRKNVTHIGIGLSRNPEDKKLYVVLIFGLQITNLSDYRSRARRKILAQVNKFRDQHELGDLRPDTVFHRAARNHALAMKNQNFFAHEDLEGRTPFDRINRVQPDYARQVLENLASHSPMRVPRLAEKIVRGWANSPGHRKNMMTGGVKVSGLGLSFDYQLNRIFIVHNFGKKRDGGKNEQ